MSAQLDHLRAIDAHLKNLLDIAAKRSPGEWGVEQTDTTNWIGPMRHDGDKIDLVVCDTDRDGLKLRAINQNDANADFIASCAGNAEAGWKATRAAIADWLSLYNSTEGYADGASDASAHNKLCNEVAAICRINLQHILAAFPLELIEG